MLDTDTKRRIDTARDILVGKVPDPKSQVEQITIALIYKFMDDMDAESEELGGKRKFFTGDYARYGWAKLMAPSLGGHAMLGLYGEGIAKMPENPGIPPLFRDIFKNAYLPYRDPETLKAFLKIIDVFSYDHSERLGDAFEYLFSVLGSQGDAGQFRTPRHIIDFMVEVLAPQKNETILDPACGTAGFLISAYKHILRSNTDAKGHSTLTPDDKGRLAKNFKGYDISPDMVRLSLVNLYLHGFTDPHIFEYDTLTSEERWNEFADVILANPPFMSPKGGIKPHRRFSIQAKRSEVLFVDYMAEHLTPTGRAAIIVPEGIIFQSQTAYKELRKMLVQNSLVAVVSLPAGCFNPYSGVKTSILILDKSLARQSDTIAFFKVENDGYGLGAQRRATEKNDLPQVRVELAAYLLALRSGASTESILAVTSTAQIVAKEKIAANGDYNLSGERYRENIASSHDCRRLVEHQPDAFLHRAASLMMIRKEHAHEIRPAPLPVCACLDGGAVCLRSADVDRYRGTHGLAGFHPGSGCRHGAADHRSRGPACGSGGCIADRGDDRGRRGHPRRGHQRADAGAAFPVAVLRGRRGCPCDRRPGRDLQGDSRRPGTIAVRGDAGHRRWRIACRMGNLHPIQPLCRRAGARGHGGRKARGQQSLGVTGGALALPYQSEAHAAV